MIAGPIVGIIAALTFWLGYAFGRQALYEHLTRVVGGLMKKPRPRMVALGPMDDHFAAPSCRSCEKPLNGASYSIVPELIDGVTAKTMHLVCSPCWLAAQDDILARLAPSRRLAPPADCSCTACVPPADAADEGTA